VTAYRGVQPLAVRSRVASAPFSPRGAEELATDLGAGHFPHHHGVTRVRVALGVVKLDLSEFAAERHFPGDRLTDHFQEETPR
jgi:hypothetical protein